MSKLFMLTFDDLSYPRETLLRFLDSRSEVSNWHASTLQNLVFIISDFSGEVLAELVKTQGPVGPFMVIELEGEMMGRQVHGWLPKTTLDFIWDKPVHPQLSSTACSSIESK